MLSGPAFSSDCSDRLPERGLGSPPYCCADAECGMAIAPATTTTAISDPALIISSASAIRHNLASAVYSIWHGSKTVRHAVRVRSRAGRVGLIVSGIIAAIPVFATGAAGNGPSITGAVPTAQVNGRPKRRPHPMHPQGPLPLPVDLKIPSYTPGPLPFRSGETLVYDPSWVGIPAGETRITLNQNKAHPEWWTGQMWITSSKPVDLLYRMRDYISEDFSRDSLLPNDIYILL